MTRKITLLFCIAAIASTLYANNEEPVDSLRVIDIEEIVVIASPKETTKLRQLPASVSLLSQHDMEAYHIHSLKDITGITPNIFIPDYGSRLTSAIYIRGIGSRINTPAVGLYVDNVPYIDKSAFDFNYYDIERIDILRGPQGTLYGRNTMGGLVKVHTRSPFDYQGTDHQLSAGSYNNYTASLTKYHRISDTFAFSAGGYYQHEGGYFKNHFDNKRADGLDGGGGRIRAVWLPQPQLKLDFNISYDYSDQGGYPYGEYHPESGKIDPVNYNDKSGYYRGLFNTSLNLEYQGKRFVLNAVTGYQQLKDRMFMDQDFSPQSVFTLRQGQRQHTLSEEITLKSSYTGNWQWVTGLFGFHQTLKTAVPVTFKETGVSMIEDVINEFLPNGSGMTSGLTINNAELLIPGDFKTPVSGAAVFHQSTYNNLLVKGVSVTAGLRLDYEHTRFTYDSNTSINYDFYLTRTPFVIDLSGLEDHPSFTGKANKSYLHLLPKFAIQYDFNRDNNLYISATRGFRSGGFNIQMFSDIIQSEMQNDMKRTIRKEAKEALLALGTPETVIDNMILNNIPVSDEVIDIKESTLYKPEYTWNYEIGTHLTLLDRRVQADLAAFYMDTRDQQVAVFVESALGRRTINAGKSRSYGFEAAFRMQATDNFSLTASYGYTNAKFRDYDRSKEILIEEPEEGEAAAAVEDYSGNYIPFVPRNTLNIGGEYIFRMKQGVLLKNIVLNVNYNGAGKLYWTEKNDIRQDFYGTLNARATAVFSKLEVALWAQNILNKHYATFYFETIGHQGMSSKAYYMQKGKPVHLGVDLRVRF